MHFGKLMLIVVLCLIVGALGGAYVVDSLEGEPVFGAVVGSLAGVALALLAAGNTTEAWLALFLPPHEDESAESR